MLAGRSTVNATTGHPAASTRFTSVRVACQFDEGPQLIGLAMGFSSKELGLNQHIVSTKAIVEKASVRV